MRVLEIIAQISLFAGLFYGLYRLVQYGKRKSRGAYALGSLLMLFGVGNVRDPSNQAIQEARQYKHSEDDDSGEPPDGRID